MYTQRLDEKEITAQDETSKLSPRKWQSMRRLEKGVCGKPISTYYQTSPTILTKSKQLISNQARMKNSLKCLNFSQHLGTMMNVIKPRQEKVDINEKDESDTDFFRKATQLNLNLNRQDMELISFNVSKYHDEYEEKEVLGEGCIGLVKGLLELRTGNKYAVKQVSTCDEEVIINMIKEFKSLVELQHPNIVKVHKLFIDFKDGFQGQSKIYVIMELVEGKEMFQYIQELGHYSEKITKKLFHQLLSAIDFLHNHGICHRDLKPNNLLCSEGCDLLKITDFNVSKFSEDYKGFFDIQEGDQIEMWTYTGTVAFSAPEIFIGYGYNEKVDLWSAGCILYTMLCGTIPFQMEYLNDLIDLICSGVFVFSPEKWHNISKEAQDLINKLLVVDSDKRYSAEQALNHNWFKKNVSSEPITSIKRIDLNQNISRLTRKNERKYEKLRTNFILFGPKHFHLGDLIIEEDCYFDSLERKKNLIVQSTEVLRNDHNSFCYDSPRESSLTSLECVYVKSTYAQSHQNTHKMDQSQEIESPELIEKLGQ